MNFGLMADDRLQGGRRDDERARGQFRMSLDSNVRPTPEWGFEVRFGTPTAGFSTLGVACLKRAGQRESKMDTTTLIVIIVIVIILAGGWYGRGRWY